MHAPFYFESTWLCDFKTMMKVKKRTLFLQRVSINIRGEQYFLFFLQILSANAVIKQALSFFLERDCTRVF